MTSSTDPQGRSEIHTGAAFADKLKNNNIAKVVFKIDFNIQEFYVHLRKMYINNLSKNKHFAY